MDRFPNLRRVADPACEAFHPHCELLRPADTEIGDTVRTDREKHVLRDWRPRCGAVLVDKNNLSGFAAAFRFLLQTL